MMDYDPIERDECAVTYADNAFVICPRCGKQIPAPDRGFDSQEEADAYALEHCGCADPIQHDTENSVWDFGACVYCGQVIALERPAKSVDMANVEATLRCTCAEARAAQREIDERVVIAGMFPDVPKAVIDVVQKIASLTHQGLLAPGSTLKLDHVTVKVKMKDGVVSILRTEKTEHQRSLDLKGDTYDH